MLPIDPNLLLIVKFFVLLTCIFFWIKLLFDQISKSMRMRSHYHRHED